MKAAVVTDFTRPPRYQDFADPVAQGEREVVVQVLAAGLHQRVRSQADGSHYTSSGELPLVPGIDAVVRDPDGRIRYTILDDTSLGTMAERTVIELDRSVVLPDTIDPVAVAAAMNPAMSSWVALRRRIDFGDRSASGNPGSHRECRPDGDPGRQTVRRVPGDCGGPRHHQAGRTACARRRSDLHVRPAGSGGGCRRGDRLRLGRGDRCRDGGDPDQPGDRGRPLTWLEVGAIAGPVTSIPAAALRSARLQIVGQRHRLGARTGLRRRASEAGRGRRRRCVRHPRQVRAARRGRAGMDGHEG